MANEEDVNIISAPILGNLNAREWHGFVDGFYSGFVWGHRQSDYDKEKHYWRAGYIIATLFRYNAIAVALTLVYRELNND